MCYSFVKGVNKEPEPKNAKTQAPVGYLLFIVFLLLMYKKIIANMSATTSFTDLKIHFLLIVCQ